jgi:phytoene/squalene synthetase
MHSNSPQRARSTDHCQIAEHDLAAVVDALPELPEAIQAGIVAMAKTYLRGTGKL